MSKAETPKTTEGQINITSANTDAEQICKSKRKFIKFLIGLGAILAVGEAKPIISCINNSQSNGETTETFMGVKLKIVTPKHKTDELPQLQQDLMKKPGAKYDKHTGNVLYGTPAEYMMDEPVVEFEHTLVEGYGKNSKTFKGKLQLKISVAKALIQAEKELGEPIPVREGIRSNQLQKLWYERNNCLGDFAKSGCSPRPYPTAPPGLSEHEKAQAIDIDTRQRLKYKKVLIKYGFLDDTRKRPSTSYF